MEDQSWRTDLKACFEDLQVISKCREEALERFIEFVQFVAEPAFEALIGEFKAFKVGAAFRTRRGVSTHFEIRFPRSRVDQFHYILWMPKNAVELKLRLTVRGRRTPSGPLDEKTVPFIQKVAAKEILNLEIDALAGDIVARYRKFLFDGVLDPD